MTYLKRNDLTLFIGKTMYVVCVNKSIFRSIECAYWIAESKEDAKYFFDSIADSMPAQSVFSIAMIDIRDISTFSLLFDQNYPGFHIIGYGFVCWWMLIERKPQMVLKLCDILMASLKLWYPVDERQKICTEVLGTAHVVQSFYTRKELAEQHGTPIMIDFNTFQTNQQWPLDVMLLTLDGEPIYGSDFYDAICLSCSRNSEDVLFTEERITQLIERMKSKYNTPKWDITAEPIEADDIFISKIGGFPYWPLDMEYPVGENGQPLFLLAQIVFADFGGMLQFFIANDNTYGCNFHDQTDTSNFRVVHHVNIDHSVTIDSVRERNIPSSAEAGSSVLLPMSTVAEIHLNKGADCLSMSMPFDKDLVCAETAVMFGLHMPRPFKDNIKERLWNEFRTDGSKLYGLPFFTQDDPRDENKNYHGKDYSILLLQLDSTSEINLRWGDSGICNFFISPDDLDNRNFNNGLYNWDCY